MCQRSEKSKWRLAVAMKNTLKQPLKYNIFDTLKNLFQNSEFKTFWDPQKDGISRLHCTLAGE
jgi:hypothetical protein